MSVCFQEKGKSVYRILSGGYWGKGMLVFLYSNGKLKEKTRCCVWGSGCLLGDFSGIRGYFMKQESQDIYLGLKEAALWSVYICVPCGPCIRVFITAI